MAYGSMTEEQMEQLMINELRKNTQIADYMGKPIAGFSGKGSSVKIYRNPQGGYYGDTGDFDFSANNLDELMEKLKRIGATDLDFGKI